MSPNHHDHALESTQATARSAPPWSVADDCAAGGRSADSRPVPRVATFGALAAALLFAGHAAGSTPSGFVTGGVAVLPEYEGSADLQLVPFVAGEARVGNRYVLLEGTALRANVVDSAQWEAGPAASYLFGRDDDVDSAAVARLPAVDDAFELGAFVARRWSGVFREGDVLRVALQATTDVTGVHDGWQLTPTLSYGTAIGNRFSVRFDLSVTHASREYVRTYVGVTPGGAAASGLSTFDPGAGAKDATVGATWSWAATSTWSVDGYVGVRRLLGDAADSPVVAEAGDPTQLTIAIGIGRRF